MQAFWARPRGRAAWIIAASSLALLLLIAVIRSYPVPPPISAANGALPTDDPLLQQVFNQTLGFQKIYVILLASRTDHRDALDLSSYFTGLDIEYIDGVTEVAPKAVPPNREGFVLTQNQILCWRAHMNAVQRMVEDNVQSALILEQDADWDLRIKKQMRNFARASRLLLQPLPGTQDQYLDPTWPTPEGSEGVTNFDVAATATTMPTTSPYSDLDRWDVLWLGHCGALFPAAEQRQMPIGRVVIPDDKTVVAPKHFVPDFGNRDLTDQYPPHTRVVSRTRMNTCAQAYALSLPGARRVLHEMGVRELSEPFDVVLRHMCDGTKGRVRRNCLSVQPQLFEQHRPAGPASRYSDIQGHGNGFNERAYTNNVRWSARVNIERFIDGRTDYIDSYRDKE